MIPTWFLYLQGFALIVLGAAQIRLNPKRRGGATFVERYGNMGMMWSIVCIVAGLALLAMAKGYWNPWAPHDVGPNPRR